MMTMISVILNGSRRNLPEGSTISDCMLFLGIELDTVAIAVNGIVIAKSDFDELKIKEGDEVELVRPVSGG